MASIKKVEYFVAQAANKPGEGARMLKALKKQGVGLLAMTAFPNGKTSQVDFVPQESAALKTAAKKLGWKLSEKKTGFLVQGADRIGVLVGMMEKLGNAGINVTAIDAVTAGAKRFGAILWVKAQDVSKAARLIHAKSR